MEKTPKPYLAYILETLQLIRENTPADKAIFMSDPNARDATLMRLHDIGEQLNRLRDSFPDFYDRYRTDDWSELIGLRNIISHGYGEIEFEKIWLVVNENLPSFTKQVQAVIRGM